MQKFQTVNLYCSVIALTVLYVFLERPSCFLLNIPLKLTAMSSLLSGIPGQPPPLLKPSGPQVQRHPPPLQPQGGVPRSNQGGLQGPPPLIKPMVRPIQPQVSLHTTMFKYHISSV